MKFSAAILSASLLTIAIQANANSTLELSYLNDQPNYIVDAGCAVFLEENYGQPDARWVGKFDYPLYPAWFGINGQDVNINLDGELLKPGDSAIGKTNEYTLKMTAVNDIPCDFECEAVKTTLEVTNSAGVSITQSVIFQCDI